MLPTPNNARISRKLQEGGIVAAATFAGLPLDYEVRPGSGAAGGPTILRTCLCTCTGACIACLNAQNSLSLCLCHIA